jgi:hypothetical protein
MESGGRVCLGAFGRNLASVAVNVFDRYASYSTTDPLNLDVTKMAV